MKCGIIPDRPRGINIQPDSATVGFADVTSANIVGYTTMESPAASHFKAMTVSFEDVAAGATVKIAELISGAFTGKPAFNDAADQIWLWDTTNGDWIQYYFRRTAGGSAVDIGWCKKGQQEPTADTITNGETFFYRRANSTQVISVTLSGAVKPFIGQAKYEGIPASKYKFVGYPWPVAMPINDFTKYMSPAPTGKPAFNDAADQIWLWDTTNSDWIQYYFRRTAGGSAMDIGWCKKGEQAATADTIPAGEGFFFRRANSQADATITFTYEEKVAE